MNMDETESKNPKTNKNHNRQKMFRIGISVGQNDLNVEGHLQMGTVVKPSKTTTNLSRHNLFIHKRNRLTVKYKTL